MADQTGAGGATTAGVRREPTAAALLNSLQTAPPRTPERDLAAAIERAFGIAVRGLTGLGGERDLNYLLHSEQGRFVAKVSNPAEADSVLGLQCLALEHVRNCDPGLCVPRLRRTLDGGDWAAIPDAAGGHHRLRLLTFLPGRLLGSEPKDPRLLAAVGRFAARLDLALQGFHHPGADHPLAWDLKRAHVLAPICAHIQDAARHDSAAAAFERFRLEVLPGLPGLRAQVIHNDISFHNALVAEDSPWTVRGVFDFGDTIFAPRVQELAVTAAEVPAECPDPLAASAAIVAGYHRVSPLDEEEFELLPHLVAVRLALSLALAAWGTNADEREYLLDFDRFAWAMLRRVDETGPARLGDFYRSACGIAPSRPAIASGADSRGLLERRRRRMGTALELSYDEPLHAVRGEGVWLYDASGRCYLDAYNNVPQVGHCHPRVVAAIARQAAALNTNTRYLYDAAVDYAEGLTATLPEPLDTCIMVSSGSEANDLAWRIAKHHTGHTGAVVMERAYHGITDAVAALSPSDDGRPPGLAAHVATVPPPDDYRGEWRRDDARRGTRYAAAVGDALRRLDENGHRPAAFMIDTILSSNGIIVPPPGFLQGTFERIRAAGGLCIADEVQAGFGRTGDHMWGFEHGGVVPDLVTLGKPIGNGHPIGAVATRAELADGFVGATDFFSTTGGNPVSCAAALAVLDVLEAERLQENARTTGEALRERIRELGRTRSLIGDVRGAGLFVGVELVRDRVTLTPAGEEAEFVVNHMRDEGVLIGREGAHGSVLKVRPPLPFGPCHVPVFIAALDAALAAAQRC